MSGTPASRPATVARWCALFLVAFALRAIAVVQYEARHPQAEAPVIDERAYDAWAREIAAGDWLGDEVFFQEPLYPYALAVVYRALGPDRTAVRLVQCALGAATCVLAGLAARRLFGALEGWLAGGLLAIHGPLLWFPTLLLKENLFVPVLAGLALALVAARGARGFFLVGVLAGLGALLRGNLLVLLPVLVAWPLLRRTLARARDGEAASAVRSSAAVLAGVVLCLAPVALRNRAVGGELVLTTSGAGTNLYGGNNAENPWGRATEFSWVRGIPEHEAGDWRREAERRTGRALGPRETSAFWRDETLRSVADDPLLHAGILWRKLRLTLGAYEVPDNHLWAWDRRFVPWLALPWPGFGVAGALGLAGAAAFALVRGRGARDRSGALEVLALAALYAATVVLTVTSARIRMPLVPLLAPFAAGWIAAVLRLARARVGPGLAPGFAPGAPTLAAALLFGLVAVHAPTLSAAERAEDLEKRDFNLAVQRMEEGRDDDARELLEELAARHARSARVRTLLAELDLRRARTLADERAAGELLGRAADGLARIVALPELSPRERFRAHTVLGAVELERGRASEAVAALAAARAFDGDDPGLRLAHARALLAAAGDALPERRVALCAEARELVHALATGLGPDAATRLGPELELVRARADLELGRARIAAGAEGTALEEARDLVRDGLARLEPLAEGPLAGPARELAGWLQLDLGNVPAAERHFRAALAAADGPATRRGARLGLLQALVDSTRDGASADPESVGRRSEARALLRELEQDGVLAPDRARELERLLD